MYRTVFFSKVNIDSSDVYRLIEEPEYRYKITRDILSMMKHGESYLYTYSYLDENGESHEETIRYSLNILEKDDVSIYGTFDRTGDIFVRQRDAATGRLKSRAIESTDDIEFYYDVIHEYIAFVTRRRFRQAMFNDYFCKLMNQCAQNNNLPYSFTIDTYNEGMTIEEMQEFIKNDKEIKVVTITYRPSNPDEYIIQNAKDGCQNEKLKDSGATEKSVIFKVKGRGCIDGGSEAIQEEINALSYYNTELPVEDATRRGYISLSYSNKKGVYKSTTDKKPVIRRIKEEDGFLSQARDFIIQILGGLL